MKMRSADGPPSAAARHVHRLWNGWTARQLERAADRDRPRSVFVQRWCAKLIEIPQGSRSIVSHVSQRREVLVCGGKRRGARTLVRQTDRNERSGGLKSALQGRAFTLIELLIAVAIFAMVLLAINGVFYGAMRLRSKTTRMIEASLPIQQTVAIIKRDLQGIVAPGGVLAGALTSGTAASSTSRMTPQGSTEIYTCTGLLDEISPWADVQKVAYYLRNPTNQATAFGKDLVRAVTRNLLATVEEQPMEQWLMGDVERVALFFYDGTSWRDSWDSTTPDSATGQTNLLPKAVKFQLELAETDAEPRNRAARQNKMPVEIVVPIFAQSRSPQPQNTGGQQ